VAITGSEENRRLTPAVSDTDFPMRAAVPPDFALAVAEFGALVVISSLICIIGLFDPGGGAICGTFTTPRYYM
jgi:hypothetical protein